MSLITGFFECANEAEYRDVPRRAKWLYEGGAWMIEGTTLGHPVRNPVVVPPIANFLTSPIFNQRTISRITKREFDRVRDFTRDHRFDPKRIPCLGREPRSEQEVLAIVACGHRKLGIETIVRLQAAFPDMLVKLKGKTEEVHLEVEFYSTSFLSHNHARQVRKRRFRGDGKPVAVLCWIDDDRHKVLGPYVHKVYELQSLLRDRDRIRW